MNKKLLTAAVASALAIPSAAMAVEVFGTIDTGIRSQSKVGNAAASDSVISVSEGQRTTNRWGFKGSEDLGDGLMANYWFEGQYASDIGGGPGSATPANQGLFQRKNTVGLSKGGNSVDLGRDYTVNFKSQGIYDPMSYTYTNEAPTAGTNTAGVRSSNLVTAGFRFGTGGVRVDYAMGEVVGQNSWGTRYGLMGDFAFGPVTVTGAYSTMKDAATGTLSTKTTNIGAAWNMGAFTFRGGWSKTEAEGGTDTPMFVLGAQYAFSPTLNGRVGYYSVKYENNASGAEVGKRKVAIVALDYNLSKRTTLYVAFDRAGLDGNQIGTGYGGTIGAGGTAVTADDGSTGIMAGIAHSF